ncbi:CD3072 family TudS-related putative desulfidase [uncultured Ruthenibacterium sp.]|uniref:CD3072 family TudS-related putative desulfidase n=1 Tax=uncultured Ruthenibacterium sp. TaxID=1905347 RepID=UPI00349EEEB8
MQKIIFTSHCLLNTAAKVVLYNEDEIAAEEALRRRFLKKALEQGVQIIQFPCPEFTLYGANRWGHVSDQFDNPFFRAHCRNLLAPYLQQMHEYLAHPDRFQILGIVGIDGSPSCGVDYTSHGNWYGSFGSRKDLDKTLQSVTLAKRKGVFMDELCKMLKEENLDDRVKVVSLFAPEPEKCMALLD